MVWGWWIATALAEPVTIGLVEALDHASRHNPQIEASVWQTEEARAALRETAGFAPELSVAGSVVRYDQPIETPLVTDDPLLIRPQQFATLSATAKAPLTQLFALAGGYQARRHQLLAQRGDERTLRDQVAVSVVEAYTGALAAEALVEVSQAVVASLRSTQQRIVAFEAAGLAQRTDVLRIEVALGDAEQSARSATRSLALARRGLALVVGHDADTLIPEALEPRTFEAPPLDEGLSRVAGRDDVTAAVNRVTAAKAARRAQVANLLPQITALARFDAFTEVGVFGIPQQFQVALEAEFDFFQLGRRNATVRKATARLRRAEVGARALRSKAELDTRAAWDRLQASLEAAEVADLQVEQATENLRLVDARFEVQLASTSDQLDAEQLLAQSRVKRVVARHEVIAALADWQRQTGLPIDPGGTP
ncbi:MAG: TolC family protein [Myxococcota bacterium]